MARISYFLGRPHLARMDASDFFTRGDPNGTSIDVVMDHTQDTAMQRGMGKWDGAVKPHFSPNRRLLLCLPATGRIEAPKHPTSCISRDVRDVDSGVGSDVDCVEELRCENEERSKNPVCHISVVPEEDDSPCGAAPGGVRGFLVQWYVFIRVNTLVAFI